MEGSLPLPVSVQRRIHIVNVRKDTTAEEVVCQLARVSGSARPQVLLEVWNSCSRVCRPAERLRESIAKWGDQARLVSWVVDDQEKFAPMNRRRTSSSSRCARRNWRRRAFRGDVRSASLYGVGGMATRKTPCSVMVVAKARKPLRVHAVQQMKKQIEACEFEIQKLTDQLDDLDGPVPSKTELIAGLEPILQEEYLSITDAITKEKKTKCELQKHKRELKQIIESRRSETATLEAKIDSLKTKIETEKKRLAGAKTHQEVDELPEIKAARQKLEELQNHFRAKQKITNHQALKLQELAAERSQLKHSIEKCMEEISCLRLDVYGAKDGTCTTDYV